jgi:GNAT superfamily N-acetyltransferase
VNIRQARPGDEAAIAGLLGVLGYPASTDEARERLDRCAARGNGKVIVAVADDRVVGFAAIETMFYLNRDAPVCYVTSLAVRPGSRRQGVGRKLLEGIERLARRGGCGRVVVTSAEQRVDAHRFYAANGWDYTGRRFAKELDSD